jgi:hypothetical protein
MSQRARHICALRDRALLLCLAMLMAGVSPNALTRADETTNAASREVRNDDIVVTARRAWENIQATPVSVAAFNEEVLRLANIQSTSDLMFKTPGVYLSGSGGRENSVFQIRVQTKALGGSNALAVVSYLADVPQSTFGSGVWTYDMASVQVLKGPQGTLFGRNTTGGAVLYYPAAPGYEWEGYLQADYGNFDHKQLEGAFTLPMVTDRLSVRFAGRHDKRDGYTRNIGLGGDLDDVNSPAFRVSVLAEPTDSIRNLTIFDWYRNYYTGDGAILLNVNDAPSLVDLLGIKESAQAALAAQKAGGPRVVDSDVEPTMNRTRRWGLTNRTDITLGDIELVAIFGYRKTYVEYNFNTDGVPRLDSTLAPGLSFPLLNAGAISHVEQYTEEVQLKGQPAGRQGRLAAGRVLPEEQALRHHRHRQRRGLLDQFCAGEHQDPVARCTRSATALSQRTGDPVRSGCQDHLHIGHAVRSAAGGPRRSCRQCGLLPFQFAEVRQHRAARLWHRQPQDRMARVGGASVRPVRLRHELVRQGLCRDRFGVSCGAGVRCGHLWCASPVRSVVAVPLRPVIAGGTI